MRALVLSGVLRKHLRVLRLSFAAVVCLLVCEASASAATYTVTSTGDTEDPGTLRWAIEQLEPGDTINFAVTGTITLTRHLPALLNTVTVTGPGADLLTIDGAGLYNVFNAQGTTVIISGLTIANAAGFFFDNIPGTTYGAAVMVFVRK